jgi:hypothetical protein
MANPDKNSLQVSGIFESSKIKVRSWNVMGPASQFRRSLMKTPYLKFSRFNALIANLK